MRQFRTNQVGMTLIELLAAVGVMGVLMGIALYNLKSVHDPLKSGSAVTVALFKQARTRAISTTSAYTIQPINATRIGAYYSDTCGGTLTQDGSLTLDLPDGANLQSTSWDVCYSGRGLPNSNLTVSIQNHSGENRTVEVFLGGGVREQ